MRKIPTLRYVHGDLLDAPEMIIAHGCNAQGVMASGVAKAIRDKWPEAYRTYYAIAAQYPDKSKFLGTAHLVHVENSKGVLNLITQERYGRQENTRYLSYDALDSALRTGISEIFRRLELWEARVALPLIGAGLAQGRWPIIAEILREIAFDMSVTFVIYVPDDKLFFRLKAHEDFHGRLKAADYSATA